MVADVEMVAGFEDRPASRDSVRGDSAEACHLVQHQVAVAHPDARLFRGKRHVADTDGTARAGADADGLAADDVFGAHERAGARDEYAQRLADLFDDRYGGSAIVRELRGGCMVRCRVAQGVMR